jgi:hypothetical protein
MPACSLLLLGCVFGNVSQIAHDSEDGCLVCCAAGWHCRTENPTAGVTLLRSWLALPNTQLHLDAPSMLSFCMFS